MYFRSDSTCVTEYDEGVEQMGVGDVGRSGRGGGGVSVGMGVCCGPQVARHVPCSQVSPLDLLQAPGPMVNILFLSSPSPHFPGLPSDSGVCGPL